VSACDGSDFASRNLVVYVTGAQGELIQKLSLYAATNQTVPCTGDVNTLRLNYSGATQLQNYNVKAKRTL
jgi:hypothetical protein